MRISAYSTAVAILLAVTARGAAEPAISIGTIGYLEPTEIKVANPNGVRYLHYEIGFNESCRIILTTPFEVLADDVRGVLVRFPETRMLDAIEAVAEGFARMWPWSSKSPAPTCLPGTATVLPKRIVGPAIKVTQVRELAIRNGL